MDKMREKGNILVISTDIPLKFEQVKKSLKENHNLLWTDFLVLCTLVELEKSKNFIQTSDIVKYIGRNRGWVYNSMKRLKRKQLIGLEKPDRFNQPTEVWINGMGHSLLNRVFRSMRLNEMDMI